MAARSFQQIINDLKAPPPPTTIIPSEIFLPEEFKEKEKKREWQVTDLGGDFSDGNIVAQLTSDKYLHNSSKQLRLLFSVLAKGYEQEYISRVD